LRTRARGRGPADEADGRSRRGGGGRHGRQARATGPGWGAGGMRGGKRDSERVRVDSRHVSPHHRGQRDACSGTGTQSHVFRHQAAARPPRARCADASELTLSQAAVRPRPPRAPTTLGARRAYRQRSAPAARTDHARARVAHRARSRPGRAPTTLAPGARTDHARARPQHQERPATRSRPRRASRTTARRRRRPPQNERVTRSRHSLHLHFCNSREQTPLQRERALRIPAVERREMRPALQRGRLRSLLAPDRRPRWARAAPRAAQKETGPLGTGRSRASGGGGAAMRYVATRSLGLGHERVLKNSS
jgi:hypothetical protein